MSDDPAAQGPIIVWHDYGCEGWLPSSYPTLKAALLSWRPSREYVITKKLDFKVVEVSETEKITLDTPTTDQA
jgi:hypothetical protein